MVADGIGLAPSVVAIPMACLFVSGLPANRRSIYFVWLGLLILFAVVELIVDHFLEIGFRNVRWL